MTSPPPFRRELRGLALEMRWPPTYTQRSGSSNAEVLRATAIVGGLLRQNRRKLLRIAAFMSSLPTKTGLVTIGESTAVVHVAGEPVTSASKRGATSLDRPRHDSGRMPFVSAIVVACSPSPLPAPDAPRSLYPRRQHEPETSSKPQVQTGVLRSLQALFPRREAQGLVPDRLCPQHRFGSRATLPALRKPQDASSRLLPSTSTEVDVASPDTDVPYRTGWKRRFGPRKALSGSRRPRTRDAIRAVRALTPTDRVADVATGNDPAPPLDGDHVRRNV